MSSPLETKFNFYANELIKLSQYSSAYLLDYIEFKNGYKYEISQVVRLIKNDFQAALYNYEQRRGGEYWTQASQYVDEIQLEFESERYGYEQLRKKDKQSYLNTQEYSGKGYVFYGKKSLTVVGGAVQTWVGWVTFNTGRVIRSKELKTMGFLGAATGFSNFIEGTTNILYEVTDGKIDPINPVKFATEQGFLALGADEGIGEIAYDVVDYGVSFYFGLAVLTKFDKAKRIIHLPVEKKGGGLEKASLLDKLFTAKGIRLFRWGRADHERKMRVSSKPMLAYSVGNLSTKMFLLLDKHLNDEKESN
ncbi:DUF4225 domain-containing protein [Xenorhabdus bovienii]|uniref:DUF4225 domain-containing protein n=1 Tax=Xenorhabdus bovienii TaxID=40576 RepID=UPI00237C88F5|nr:DUF4225 domain-containing protein [Xenorhabdus bovienii]MDE1496954.1 DUF4225 domain-containing protein [Xenorhabdus bovienii]